ncbi:hypothetical protein RSSM_01455 [Rhodopirellula sallentina SM41]|uniref:Uncharacterized protein n=1 Tax=Rhodopirellula sallentina SM41 TaxID=1263870 RepID=M5U744_9BACT|nr:hypothetical protein RSSM_01455 [Rhodopirellula sallentina SM41]
MTAIAFFHKDRTDLALEERNLFSREVIGPARRGQQGRCYKGTKNGSNYHHVYIQ